MNERRAIKVPLGMLKGKPMSTSVPTFEFRFHAAEEQLEEIYPEIEEEVAIPLDPAESSEAAPVAPPRSPKPSHSAKFSPGPKLPRSLHSPVNSSPEPSPLKEALKPGILSKRSTSMETGIGESAAVGPAGSDTWRILHELKGKITRTMEDKLTEIKNDRIARNENRKNRLAASAGKKEDASFSDSEDASSSENSNLMNPVPNSNSASQLSGASSLSSTPTGTGTGTGTTGSSRTRKLSRTDDDSSTHSRPTTPSISEKSNSCKATRAGSVPTLVGDSPTLDVPPKRSLSLRSQIKPKFCELRNRKKKAESRSNPAISSTLFLGDGEESDEGDATDAVEEGVEALEEDWPDTTVTPSVPLGTMLSALNDLPSPPPPPPSLTLKQKVWLHRYVVAVIVLSWFMMMLPAVPVPLFVLLGALVVMLVQEEAKIFSTPSASVASMNMGYAPFSYPNYSEMPVAKVPAAAEVVPAPCFEGWMNEFAGKYETNSYHISLTESVFVRLEGSMLTLKYTRVKIPKRAMWNEPATRKVTFTHVRYFNIRGCQVKLLPEGIARRRQWSKKYPMCIVLNSGSAIATPDESADLEVDEIRPMPEDEREAEKNKEETPSGKKVTASAKYAKSSTESLELTILRSDDSMGDLSKDSKDTSTPSKPRLTTNSSKEGNSDFSGAEAEDDESFSIINSDGSNCLYLFARADREKEEWYRRFAEAVRPHGNRSYEVTSTRDSIPVPGTVEIDEAVPLTPSLAVATLTEYLRYMQCFQLENKPFLISSPKTSSTVEKDAKKREKEKDKEKDKDKHKEKDSERERDKEFEAMVTAAAEKGAPMAWLNALVGRVCFDILRSAQWKKRLHQRLQKKLSTLKLPYFVEDLTVTELDLGDTVPLIHRTSQPTMDMRGLWVEMDLTYQGGFRMTIESKLNLMKLKKNVSIDAAAALLTSDLPPAAESTVGVTLTPGVTATTAAAAAAAASISRSPVFDSDLDDSAESSSDDDHSVQTDDGHRGPGANPGKTTGKKFLRMVDRIAASKYFQQATEMKYIKKAMEGVSNTRIMLSVELRGLVGTLALNIPPPPSDRLWYGFHGNPKLWLTARPTLGERKVNFNQISNWIEQKLCQEFQKVLVLPNMDDLVIPVMSSHLPV